MATQPHFTSRRELIKFAAVTSAALAVSGVAAIPAADEWHRAIALERVTRNAYEKFHLQHVVPPTDKHEALCKSFGRRPFTPAQNALLAAIDCKEDIFNDLVSAHHDAFEALMQTPAPDVAGMALKLDLFAKDESWDYVSVGEMIAGIHADAVRLSQGDA